MTRCEHCNKPLREVKEVHAVRGYLYCSRECAIDDMTNDTIMSAKEVAIEDYASCAEVVATEDILADEMRELVKEENSKRSVRFEVYATYLQCEDRTIVWQDLYVGEDIIQSMIMGWYCGEPDQASTEYYSRNSNVGQFTL